ncbi:MAG: hypothetical protein KAQ75_05290 [Bacteroidales bacterium]|nr:hypothetical protein [Bacteroidales bacterium]
MKALIKHPERILKQQNVSKEQICAYHESGHVVICYLFHLKYTKVSIIKDPITNEQGFVDTPDMLFDRATFEKWRVKFFGLIIMQYYAGIISEAFYSGKYDWKNAQYDLESVEEVFIRHDVYNNKSYIWNVTEKLVIKHWGLIDYLAKVLLEKKELTNHEVENLLQEVKIKLYPPALEDL